MPFLGAAMVPVISGLLGVGSAVAGGLANRSSRSTFSQATTPTLSPELQGLQTNLTKSLQDRLANPGASLEPLRLNARNAVNRNFAGYDQALRDRLLASGGGRSGKLGAATRAGELARIGGLSDLEGEFARLVAGREDSTAGLAERLLAGARGSSTSGSQTLPGNVAGGALNSGLSTLSFFTALDRLLRGGRGPASFAGAGVTGFPGSAAPDYLGGDEGYNWRPS